MRKLIEEQLEFFSALNNEGNIIGKEKVTDGYLAHFGLGSKACRVE